MDAQVVIVGGGGTGGALAHDLTLRGLRVTLVERGELTSGTTGRHHGLLHSGARYAVGDPESATECIQENRILRRIAPGSFEENGGLFVALTDEDADGLAGFLAACAACSIPTRELSPDQALRLEPGLAPTLKAAVWVPDATMDAMRLPLRFFATARANGAVLRPFTEVFGVLRSGGTVTGVAVRDHLAGRDAVISADVVVNRLHRAGDGDIVLPQRGLSVVGTSSWVVDDPDDLEVPADHVEAMFREGARLVPAVATATVRAAWSAARPLVGAAGAATGRELSRTFKCFDHAGDGVEGLVTITGGKATTLRGSATPACTPPAAPAACGSTGARCSRASPAPTSSATGWWSSRSPALRWWPTWWSTWATSTSASRRPDGRWSGRPTTGPRTATRTTATARPASTGWSASRTASSAACACPPARWPAAIPATRARPRSPPPGGWPASRAAATRRPRSPWPTTARGRGAATWRSSAPRCARRASTPPAPSWRCAAGCSATGWPGRWRGGDGGEGAGGRPRRALVRPARPPPGRLGVHDQPGQRARPVLYLYLHLVVLSTLLRGPEAWDGLVELFKRPWFLALDVVLVVGLLLHGLSGLHAALVGSGLVVGRQRALYLALMIIGALVALVAAVRILT